MTLSCLCRADVLWESDSSCIRLCPVTGPSVYSGPLYTHIPSSCWNVRGDRVTRARTQSSAGRCSDTMDPVINNTGLLTSIKQQYDYVFTDLRDPRYFCSLKSLILREYRESCHLKTCQICPAGFVFWLWFSFIRKAKLWKSKKYKALKYPFSCFYEEESSISTKLL